MFDIKAEGTYFKILSTPYEVDALKPPNYRHSNLERFMRYKNRLATDMDTRLALFVNMLNPSEMDSYVLIWQDNTDLQQLDQKIAQGNYTDADFASCFRADLRRLTCPNCGHEVTALTFDRGNPYPGNPKLLDQKLDAIEMKSCPVCASSLRQIVLKCFD